MKNGPVPTWGMLWLTTLMGVLVVFFANPSAVDRLFEGVGLNRVLYPEGKSSAFPTSSLEVLPDPLKSQKTSALFEKDQQNNASEPVTLEQDSLDKDNGDACEQNAQEEPNPSEKISDRLLYFLGLDPEGRSVLFPVKRELQEGMTPLTASLKALLLGPTVQEKSRGAFTLIPRGVRLLSIKVHHKTAFLSFSQEFLSNPYGLEGFAGQLKQITWTATQFLSVDQVEFLIDGQQHDFLAEEGLSIATPFHRSSFP